MLPAVEPRWTDILAAAARHVRGYGGNPVILLQPGSVCKYSGYRLGTNYANTCYLIPITHPIPDILFIHGKSI